MARIPYWRQRQIDAQDAAREERAIARMGVVLGLEDTTMPEPDDLFGAMALPDDPFATLALPDDDPPAPEPPYVPSPDDFDGTEDMADARVTKPFLFETPENAEPFLFTPENALVSFPVPSGHPLDLAVLEEPSSRMATLVEALLPFLAPPAECAKMATMTEQLATATVTDTASRAQVFELMEAQQQNEKGLAAAVERPKQAFHRAWKVITTFESNLLAPSQEARRYASRLLGKWDAEVAETARREAQARADAEAKAERLRLQQIAEANAAERIRLAREMALAEEQGRFDAANALLLQEADASRRANEATRLAAEVVSTPVEVRPAGGRTTGRSVTRHEAVLVDEEAFWTALATDKALRAYLTIEQGKLNTRANTEKAAFNVPGWVARPIPTTGVGGRK